MGGSDQWGNITTGTEFVRRNLGGKAYAITTPLLTKADGTKFGKSEKGNIWLDPNMTTPYKFYQFWINADDADLQKFFRYFTLKTREEVMTLENEYAENPRELKRLLAEELTIRVHSQEEYDNVLKVSEILFGRSDKAALSQLTEGVLATIAEEIPSPELALSELKNGMGILDLLADKTGILPSKSEARKAIQNNAISINKDKINDFNTVVNTDALLRGKYMMIENGKKNKFMVVVG
jgi:tyrosyl-tRNA synthetase